MFIRITGASLMFLVGTRKEQPLSLQPSPSTNYNCTAANMNECACKMGMYPPELLQYNFCPRASNTGNHYEKIFANNQNSIDYDKAAIPNQFHRCPSYRQKHPERVIHYLPKSLSYAANIDLPHGYHGIRHGHSHGDPDLRFSSLPRPHRRGILRPSKSVPEGLSRWEYCGSYRRPLVRNVQVIEQITTSV